MHRDTIIVEKHGAVLCAANTAATRIFNRIQDGDRAAIRFVAKRSVAQNAMYWDCLEHIIEATGRWRTAEELHLALKVATGRVDVVQLIDGRRVLIPESTAFDAMSQDEAARYYDAALRILCDEVMGGCTVEELLQHAGVRKAA